MIIRSDFVDLLYALLKIIVPSLVQLYKRNLLDTEDTWYLLRYLLIQLACLHFYFAKLCL